MPIISKFQIIRYKQVLTTLSPGNISDGGFSTFELNSQSDQIRGTGDFNGILKRLFLLGEIEKHSIDTRNTSLQDFNLLDEGDVQRRIDQGIFVRTRQLIGWAELGYTHPSFYYEDCVVNGQYGKRTKSDNYYDLLEMSPSSYLVNGNANGIAALQRLNNWDVNETIGSWGAPPHPEQVPMGFGEYLNYAIRGGILPRGPGMTSNPRIEKLQSVSIFSVPLLNADYAEHFENNTSTFILSPSFSNIDLDSTSPEKKVYGRLRRTLQNAFKPIGVIPALFPELNDNRDFPIFENRSTVGDCIPISGIKSSVGGTYNLMYFINDNSFSNEPVHSMTSGVDKTVLYENSYELRTRTLQEPIQTVYTPSEQGVQSLINNARKYATQMARTMPSGNTIEPNLPLNPMLPPIDFDYPPETDWHDGSKYSTDDFPKHREAWEKSVIVVEQQPFRTIDVNIWKQEKSLNLPVNPRNSFSTTYTAYKKPTSPTYIMKRRIVNSGMTIEDYKNQLIFIRDGAKNQRNNLI